MSVGPDIAKQLRGVLEDIPHVQHAFAYGSGVIVQPDLYDHSSTNKPMLDFIFAVDDPVDWHAQVLSKQSSLGSSIRLHPWYLLGLCKRRICSRIDIITPY